jgi:hypothetical protein
MLALAVQPAHSATTPKITVDVTCDQTTQRTSIQAHGTDYTPSRTYTVSLAVNLIYQRVGDPMRWTTGKTTADQEKKVVVSSDGSWTVPFTWQDVKPADPAVYSYFGHIPNVFTRYYSEYVSTKGSPCIYIDSGKTTAR